jgi:hypothetical protein
MTPEAVKAVYLAGLIFAFFGVFTFHLATQAHFLVKWAVWSVFITIALFAGLIAFGLNARIEAVPFLALYGMFAATFPTGAGPLGFVQKLMRLGKRD